MPEVFVMSFLFIGFCLWVCHAIKYWHTQSGNPKESYKTPVDFKHEFKKGGK